MRSAWFYGIIMIDNTDSDFTESFLIGGNVAKKKREEKSWKTYKI